MAQTSALTHDVNEQHGEAVATVSMSVGPRGVREGQGSRQSFGCQGGLGMLGGCGGGGGGGLGVLGGFGGVAAAWGMREALGMSGALGSVRGVDCIIFQPPSPHPGGGGVQTVQPLHTSVAAFSVRYW